MNVRPSAGFRLAVTLEEGGDDLVYRGFVHLPDADLPIVVRVDRQKGAATAQIDRAASPNEDETRALELSASRLVKASAKASPPRTIVRWREKP